MKRLLVGPKWIGGWMEGVEHAIRYFGHDVRTFHYETPSAPTVWRSQTRVKSFMPAAIQNYFLPPAQKIGRRWERRMNEKLISLSRSLKVDLVFILKGETLEVETLAALKSPGRRVVSWWLDDPIVNFSAYPQVRAHLEYIDLFFLFDRGRFDELSALGARELIHLPCSVDPDIYHPKTPAPAEIKQYKCDLGFVASYYPERGELLKHMQGLDVAVWGMGWKNKPELQMHPRGTLRGKSLVGSKIASMYNVALICPNTHHSQSLLGGLNMRTFEIAAAGGFQIVDDIPGLEEQFEKGREIVVYESPEHFRELADYYLAHPAERKALAEHARERVLRDHTYRHRLRVVFDAFKRAG
jgi:spore maturation protein CgeB